MGKSDSLPVIQIGVHRPPLPLMDLPTPEEVFNKRKIGGKEIITCVLGPSMIALGAALGSGEWVLGPLMFGKYGFMGLGWLFPFVLVLGSLILFKTQATILEMLIRNTVDAANAVSPRLRAWIAGDVRKAYYALAVIFIVIISIILHLALPVKLLQISANMANFACLIYPFHLMYLNFKLPKAARTNYVYVVILLLNVVFFGFFFLNFLALEVTGTPLMEF